MNMKKLKREDLISLEQYSGQRDEFRRNIMAHKKNRLIPIGPNVTLHFEDRLIIQYQVQEMLRAEKIFEAEAIQEELDAYNPLIPDGCNWKATMMIEYTDPDERAVALTQLVGIEKQVWMQVSGFNKVSPITDEDLERETEDKTSAVHFLRFELTPEMANAANKGAAIGLGISHQAYHHATDALAENYRASLAADLDSHPTD